MGRAVQTTQRSPKPGAYSKGEPQPSHTGSSMKAIFAHASALNPGEMAAPPSSAVGGRMRSSARRPAATSAGPGFQTPFDAPSCRLMPSAPPLLFDRALHRRRLDRAALGYADFLKKRAAEDAVFRLEGIMRRFPLAVDLGARTGAFAQALAASEAAAKVDLLIETDLSGAMLGREGVRVVADEERLPFAPQSLDLAVSTLSLHWTNDLIGALVQARLALKPDGLFIGAFLGGATLTELLGVELQRPAEQFAEADGRVRATFEIITVTGWAPHESQQKPLPRGSAKMRLADALASVRPREGGDPS